MSHPYKSPPMDHQVRGLKRAWKSADFAYFWEMGTGKTFTTINLATARYLKDHINALVVFCPTPIKLVWEHEFEQWCPIDHEVVVLTSGPSSANEVKKFAAKEIDGLKVLVVGIEALSQGTAHEKVMEFVNSNKCMGVCDESSTLKNAKSIRTKRAVKIAQRCLYRIILTGTPVSQGMEDLFGQFQFLNPSIIGCKSYVHFRNKYCVMGGYQGRKVIGYRDANSLMLKISPYVDIVKKEEVLDLPPKVYERLYVDPSPNQLKLIGELNDYMEAEHAGRTLITKTILERLTRFQQIIGGHFPFNEDEGGYDAIPIEGPNPKLNALIDTIETLPITTKVIIWTRFTPEAMIIKNSISRIYGEESVVTFVGSDSDEERKSAVKNFQTGKLARFMISNPQLGGMGQTWTAATVVIYYSNSFSYQNRKQSEDRAHRKGQEHPVTYVDIEANHKYDKMILRAISAKGSVADFVEEQILAGQVGLGI
jgi:SNF2 family DNA or RNA helicase